MGTHTLWPGTCSAAAGVEARATSASSNGAATRSGVEGVAASTSGRLGSALVSDPAALIRPSPGQRRCVVAAHRISRLTTKCGGATLRWCWHWPWPSVRTRSNTLRSLTARTPVRGRPAQSGRLSPQLYRAGPQFAGGWHALSSDQITHTGRHGGLGSSSVFQRTGRRTWRMGG